ncbi:MAG: PorT family protein [Bacteroidetes bacterium]|nr:PorT family protein [Bacteroidota bacterium]
MKKALLLSAFVFLASITFAQFTIGPKIGFTMSKLNTNFENVKEEAKSGFQFGAFARYGDKLYVQPELMFVTKGGIIKSETLLSTKTTVKLSTMQIPVMVGYRLLNLNVVNLRVMGGPAFSFITDKEITLSTGNVTETIEDNNIKDAIWSIQLGAGVDVLMFTLDVRYEWGLNNIYDPQGGESRDMKSNLWNVSLGWKIL